MFATTPSPPKRSPTSPAGQRFAQERRRAHRASSLPSHQMLGMPSQQCNIADPASLSPLHRAAARSEEEVVRTLQSMRTRLTPAHFTKAVNLKASDSDRTGGYSALHYACQNGLPGAVRALLENGADPNVRKNNGMPPLMSAIHGAGRQSLNKGNASIAGNERCVELLCTHLSFDLNSNDDDSAQISPVWCCGYTTSTSEAAARTWLLAQWHDP